MNTSAVFITIETTQQFAEGVNFRKPDFES